MKSPSSTAMPDAARETSFANGGQISVSHAEPWANPGAPRKLLRWLGKRRRAAPVPPARRPAPVALGRCSSCANARRRARATTSSSIVRLGTYSREMLQQLRRDTGIDYDQRTQGILHFYTSAEGVRRRARSPAAQMRALGCDRQVIDPTRPCASSPRWRHIRPKLAGATYTAQDESGDAQPVHARAGRACEARRRAVPHESHGHGASRGGRRNWTTSRRPTAKAGFQRHARRRLRAGDGLLSPLLRAPLGIRLPIYPAKGYSVTLPVNDPAQGAPGHR